MPDLVLILTDVHNGENVLRLLPAGCVYVGISLHPEEWAKADTDALATAVLRPMLATAKARWPEVVH